MFKKIRKFFKSKYRAGVFVVTYKIEDKKIKYLILKRKLHWNGWEFPKGGMEKGETIYQAVKREIKEESGLEIIKIKKYNFKGRYNYDKKTRLDREFKGQSFKLFSAEVKLGKIKIDKIEHSGFKWCTFLQAIRLLTWYNQKKAIKIVDKELKEVVPIFK